MSSKYGDFYAIPRWGFPKQEAKDHVPSPAQFVLEYLNDPALLERGYYMEELGDGFYGVTCPSGYHAAFMLTGEGVIVIDAPPTLGENLIAAIESVTDEPVAKVVYSHWHADHIGAASMFGPKVAYVAHDITGELLQRFPDPYRPVSTETFTSDAELELGGVRLELSYKGADHCPGNIYAWAPAKKVITKIDIVSPGSVTFMHADASENISGFFQAHDDILSYDFKALVGGHISRWGTRADVEEAREYWHDVRDFADEAIKELSPPEVSKGFLTSARITATSGEAAAALGTSPEPSQHYKRKNCRFVLRRSHGASMVDHRERSRAGSGDGRSCPRHWRQADRHRPQSTAALRSGGALR